MVEDSPTFDLLVIGGGSAGYAAARTALSLGLNVAVADGSATLGGLCILRGCMPSKALIESASRAAAIREAEEFGIHTSPPVIDSAAIQARKNRLIADFAGYRQDQLTDGRFPLLRGTARFLSPTEVEITPRDETPPYPVTARAFLIASGSDISVPNLPGLAETGFWTSDDILVAETMPKTLTVLGGGAIALEMAYYAAGLGVDVTVIQRAPHVLSSFDDDVGQETRIGLERLMKIHTGTKLLRAEVTSDGKKTIHFQQADGSEALVTSEKVLVALGRKPSTTTLNLAAAGVDSNPRGRILTTDTKQTSVPHIFAAGDCADTHEVVHTAISHAETAVRNIARILKNPDASEWEQIDRRLELTCVFSEPQVASLGITEKRAADLGLEVESASHPFNDHGKSMIHGSQEGFVKLIVDKKSREIVGAAAVGPHVSELIHEVVVAMNFHATAGQFAAIPHYHPTLSEIWTYPAEDLA